ncbi:ornithine cyclodeaminase family protein [archaeon SCG-AAA382B04]|nr:ornithine cyclodeaminase family protein [archaeon SCG-AAA382B04]
MNNKDSVLKLSGDEVKKCISISETIDAVESAFSEFGRGKAQIPSKIYLFFDKYNGDYRSMPGYLEEENVAGCKLVNSHPDNDDFPTVMALLVLVDPETGFPFCLMDATELTAYRTGAAGAIATKNLSRQNSKKIGFVGAGVQAITQFKAITQVRELEEAYIYDLSDEAAKNLKGIIESERINASICQNLENLVPKLDILVTTTPVKDPIIKEKWITEGTHINAIGADAEGKQELESDIIKDSMVVVDQFEPASHAGEINVPFQKGMISEDDIYGELSEIVTKNKEGRIDDSEVTIFDSTGLAIQDVSSGYRVYKNAIKKGVGEKIDLI